MPEVGQGRRKLWDRLKDSYRVLILDDENLEEVASYNLTLLNFYVLISVLGFAFAMLVIASIVFTPVKRLIPGYGEVSGNKEYIELTRKVDELEKEIQSYDTYIKGLSNILSGGISTGNDGSAVDAVETAKPQRVNQTELMENKRARELDFLKFAKPVAGKVAARFQPSVLHYGVDILAPKDTPIKAIMDGVVINAEASVNNGNSVFIQHSKNVVSVYKHNSVLLVKSGDIVKTGQAIAIIGNTGEHSTGPHLHFEMWYDGKYVNPENYINF